MNGTKEFWCSIDNNNQANERFVGKVKMVLKQGMVEDFKHEDDMRMTDIKVKAYVCNMK